MRGLRAWMGCASAAFLAGCATQPPKPSVDPPPPGHERIEVKARGYPPTPDLPGSIGRQAAWAEPMGGVICRFHNDKGSWEVTTPGTLIVARSAARLEAECRKEGYATVHAKALCLTPKQRGTASGAMMGAQVGLEAAKIAAYAAPPVGLVLLGIAGATALGAAAGSSVADESACSYTATGKLEFYLWPDGRSAAAVRTP